MGARLRSRRSVAVLGAGAVIGLVEVILAVAFAILVFGGYLYQNEAAAIGLYLAGAAITLAVFGWRAGRHGVIGGLGEAVAAVLVVVTLKVALSTFGSPYRAYLTSVAATLVVTVATGLVFLLIGGFRWGHLIRLVPYSVVGGFMAGTGYLLLKGGVGVAAGTELYIRTLNLFGRSYQLTRWIPALVFGALILVATRVVKRPFVLPVALAIGFLLFFAGLLVSGLSLSDAWNGGWMVGPFGLNRLLEPWTYRALNSADWHALLEQSGSMATAILVAVIACFFSVTRAERVVQRELDTDQALGAAGVATVVSGPFGGIAGYHSPLLTSLGQGMRADARRAGLVAAIVPAAAALFAGQLVDLIPKFVVGGILVYVGLAFMVEWLVDAWRELPLGEWLVVLIIFGTIAVRGYLSGVEAGLIASVILFAINYSRIDLVHQVEFGSTYRSNVDRPPAERATLQALADRVLILRVNGYVFFGVASGLVERIRKRVEAGPLRFLLVDLRRVTGLDSSAVLAFRKIALLTEANRIQLVFAGGPAAVLEKLAGGGIAATDGAVRFEPDLDRGLQQVEDGLLKGEAPVVSPDGSADALAGLPARLRTYFERETLPSGTVLIRQGDPPDDLFILESGRLSVEATTPEGTRMRLSSVSSGVIVGEVALYLGGPRTADVVAETPSVVLRLSRASIERMEAEEPELAVALHRRLAERLAERASDTLRAFDALLD